MALPTNTFLSYDSVGTREDLSDVIFDISPTETPFSSGIQRNRAYQVKHEWQTDSLAAATNVGQLEGDDATADAHVATTRLDNICQIFRKVVSVSGTQRAQRLAGRGDEFEYALAKKGRELKRDIEKALLSAQAAVRSASSATARMLGGIDTWLSTNKLHLAATSTTPGGGTAIVEGNAVSGFTATDLKARVDTVIQQIWTSGGDPGVIMSNGTGKQYLSKMPGIATLYKDVMPRNQAEIVAGADAYVSDFGQHVILPNRFARSSTVLFLDMEYFAISELRPMQVQELSKTGDSDRSMLICELTLEVKNEAASGKLADVAWS